MYESFQTIQTVFITSFIVAAVALWFGRKPAEVLGLIDKPSSRKTHSGHVPLLGGLALGLALLAVSPMAVDNSNVISIVLLTLLVGAMGLIDDAIDLNAKFRFLMQLLAGLTLATWGDIRIETLGDVFGFGTVTFGYTASLIFTAFCVIGITNAVNMVDGIDGLFGGTSILTILAIALICLNTGRTDVLPLCLIVIGGLGAFLMFNLGVFGKAKKVFAGDGGSMAIGFLTAAVLILITQGDKPAINAVTAGWLVGLPLMDSVSVMLRRVLQGKSPLLPGRDHFHHHLRDSGLSTKTSLMVILTIQMLMIAIGFISIGNFVPDSIMFWMFVVLTVFHFLYSRKIIHFFRT